MLSRQIAERYAQALFDLALHQGTPTEWEADLQALAHLFVASPELHDFLTHPEIPLERKETVLKQALRGRIAPEVLATLLLLLKRGHAPDMAMLLGVYRDIQNEHNRVMPVTVTSAVPLTPQQHAALLQTLTRRTGATVQLRQRVDPDLLSGMIITMGDRVIDASARTSLDNLREAMSGT